MKNILLTLVITLFSISLSAQVSFNDRQILLELYTSTNGTNCTNVGNLNKTVKE